MRPEELANLDWDKGSGLVPAIVQDASTGRVLMLGYMNRAALRATLDTRCVTFFSRSRNTLWTKGETSGHYLDLVDVTADCDADTLLVLAKPRGPTCHKGTQSCFGDSPATLAEAQRFGFLAQLESVIAQRAAQKPEGSYTARLFHAGRTRIAQKLGEEGVEVALAAVTSDDDELIGEAADLIYHLTVLLKERNRSLSDVVAELARRHEAKG